MEKTSYISEEFKRLFYKRSVLISVFVVLFVPLIYAMIMLSPKWGPQDNIDNLPIAVVNNDEGANSEGEVINIGEELIANLEANPTLGWEFVSSDVAEKGMDNMKYYMTIEVPEEFSKKALTVLDDEPERPELKFSQNEGLHYMAAQVTDSAVNTIKNQLSTQITETYVQTVVDKLGGVSDGFSDAADGADQINDGSTQLKDGSTEMLSSLTDKSGDISRLADGASELNAGTNELLTNLTGKSADIIKLAAGASELSQGTGDLKAGTNELKSGANELKFGTGELKSGAKELKNGTGELKSGTGELKSGAGALKAGTGDLKAGASDLKSGTGELKSGTGALKIGAGDLKAGSQELKKGASELLAGSTELKDGSDALKAGITQELSPGIKELAGGVKQAQTSVDDTIKSLEGLQGNLIYLSTLDKDDPKYDATLNRIVQGLEAKLAETPQSQALFQTLVDGADLLQAQTKEDSKLYQGAIALNTGLNDLNKGAGTLNAGIVTLDAGVTELARGASDLDDGAGKLVVGAGALDTGARALNVGATDLNAGATKLNTGASDLNAGASQLDAGTLALDSGAGQLHAGVNELDSGAGELSTGAAQVADGNQTVKSGWVQLQDGATQLHDGSTQIKDGNATVKEGWGTLTDGVVQFDNGLLKLVDGSGELHEGLTGGAEEAGALDPQAENVAMFAEPVVLDGEVINSFPFYRDANAPYIITLALFVGVLAMSFVVPYRKPAILPPSAVSWYAGKFTKLASLAVVQALIISLYSLLILKIEVHSSLQFILFSVWVSLTFLMIVLFLVVLAGNIGRFIALAFAVIQLSTTGSDLPIHMLPEGLRNLSVFLPFTYSIDGFKNIVTLGSTSSVLANVGVLFIYLATFALLAGIVFFIRYRRLNKEEYEEEITESAI